MYRDYDDLINTLKKRSFLGILLVIGVFAVLVLPLVLDVFGDMNFFVFVVVLFLGIYFFTKIIQFILFIIQLEKSRKQIDAKEKKIINEELCLVIDYLTDQYLLTEHYIIVLMPKIRLIPYEDIVLVDDKKGLYISNGIGYGTHFCGTQTTNQAFVVLKNGEKCVFDVEKSRGALYKNLVNFKEIVATKNSNVLIGRTKENKKILLESYNIKL